MITLKHLGKNILAFVFVLWLALSSAYAQLSHEYDPGPDANTPMGRELINLMAEYPDYAGISIQVLGDQKFRPVFGPVTWRMLLKPNSVKILFEGQDATHIAEAAGRPATAGFGGRAMDVAKYLGVGPGAGFINAYAATIQGQYGAANSPIVVMNEDGTPKDVIYRSYVPNDLWAMSMDPQSPLAQFRNKLISWIIRNNPDSLKMVILFGGASRDAFASFIESKGGKVGTMLKPELLKNYRVPKMNIINAGGNNELAYPLTKDGQDGYGLVLGKKVNYKDPMNPPKDYVSPVETARKTLQKQIGEVYSQIDFQSGGLGGSGLIHPAQLGGYDIDKKMYINGKKTISLKGLRISDDFVIQNDILVRTFPHPTRLSMMTPEEASAAIAEPLKEVQKYVDQKKFSIPSDEGFESKFAEGVPYEYARADMGPETYDFGAPASRMVSVSSAVRVGRDVIVFGTRDKVAFVNPKKPEYDLQKALNDMADAKPSEYPNESELWTTRPSGPETRFVFDSGPGEKYASLMKDNLPKALVNRFRANRDYAHYRGTFQKPRVLIIADPHGYDDLITARALTGARGQYLQSIMEGLGVNDQYLIFKTAPFMNDDAEKWKMAVDQTQAYREAVIRQLLSESTPEAILADGPDAIKEVKRILGKKSSIPVINIKRGETANAGLREAVQKLKAIPSFEKNRITLKMKNIPRSHLSYYARWWEGTSGDRVITSKDPRYSGKAFAVVAPKWAYQQKHELTQPEKDEVQALLNSVRQKTEKNLEIVDELPKPSVDYQEIVKGRKQD